MATRIYLLRHGNTAKAENDLDRELTEKGMAQALARREALDNPTFDLVLSSPAKRAVQTAAIVAGIPIEQVGAVSTLYMPEDQTDRAAMEAMFAGLMYAPLRTYREADKTGVLYRYGQGNEEVVIRLIDESQCSQEKNILITGHAVMLNAVVSYICGGDTDLILDANLGEVEGFKIIADFSTWRMDVELVV